jgi:hypothetical protein
MITLRINGESKTCRPTVRNSIGARLWLTHKIRRKKHSIWRTTALVQDQIAVYKALGGEWHGKR